MIFNSLSFAIFLPVVFVLYWFIINKKITLQNSLLLISSYFFYACWDWRFLFLLIFSTLLDYFSGLKISATEQQYLRKFWLWLSIVVNVGLLGFFKYYNFFITSFATALHGFGIKASPWTLNIILPIGISFYTFHGLSYVIDIYHRKIKPEKNIIDYAVFVSFFPLLVAGPIERANHLLPQIRQKRTFNYQTGINGLKQILWGLFKKIVIADNCGEFANLIFDNANNTPGSAHMLGAVFFAFQIYGDFSGYSDIAIGTARLFGIDLIRNFAFPYFSRDIGEFWRRWHISLSSWFRDYVYIPLGGSRGGTWTKIRNTFIIFIISGFWHGAKFTFIVWGILHALYFLPLLLTNKHRNNIDIVAKGKVLPTLRETLQMLATFTLVCFAWIFFRAASMPEAINYILKIFSKSLFIAPAFLLSANAIITIALVGIFILAEWAGREQQYAIEKVGANWKWAYRWLLYYAIALATVLFAGTEQQFIYFQF